MLCSKLVLVVPNRLTRAGILHMLESCEFGEIVEAQDVGVLSVVDGAGAELLIVDCDARPDLAADDFEVLRARHATARIVAISAFDDAGMAMTCYRAPVDGLVSKNSSKLGLLRSLELVMAGERVVSSTLFAACFNGTEPEPLLLPQALPHALSGREAEILRTLVDGHTNKYIGNLLGIAEATVKVHIKAILRKINVRNRTQAAIWAFDNVVSAEAQPAAPTPAAKAPRMADGRIMVAAE